MKTTNLRPVLITLLILLILTGCTAATAAPPTSIKKETSQPVARQATATPIKATTTAIPPSPTASKTPSPTKSPSATATPTVVDTVQSRPAAESLQVLEVQPPDGTLGVRPDAVVTVFFNRPVVVLTAIEDAGDLPNPLTFTPPVEGTGEWLNTSTFQFTPGSAGFRRATEYTARIERGLIDTFGEAVLSEDVEWQFMTIVPTLTPTPTPIPTPAPPLVTDIFPANKSIEVSPHTTIELTFNKPMYRQDVQDKFRLIDVIGGEPVAGIFTWRGQPESFTFTPAEPLKAERAYRIELPRGTQAEYGQEAIPRDVTATFAVSPNPVVEMTHPSPGGILDPGDSIRIGFNTKMRPGSVIPGKNLTITPTLPITQFYTYWRSKGTDLVLNLPLDFSQAYTLTLGADIENQHGQPLGKPYTLTWQTRAQAALLFIESPGHIATYNAYTDTTVLLTTRNVKRVDLSLYRLPVADFISFYQDDWDDNWKGYRADADNLLRSWPFNPNQEPNTRRSYRLSLEQAQGVFYPLTPGLYYLEAGVPPDAVYATAGWTSTADPWERQVLVVGNYNVTLKTSGYESLAWVTDLQSGQPVVGQPVTFIHGSAKMESQTAEDGVAQVDYGRWRNPEELRFAFVGDPDNPGDNFAVGVSRWSGGINRYDFQNVETENAEPHYSGHFYTHRPLYRPGETVHFKGIIRANDDARYALPEQNRRVTVLIHDDQGNEVYQQDLPLSQMGTVNDTLELAADTSLGRYQIRAAYAGQDFFDTFEVSAYRLPEFSVSVQTDRARYTHGDTINVTVAANFFFGGPVSEAWVRWTLLSDNFAPRSQTLDAYDFVNEAFGDDYVENSHGGFGPRLAEGEGITGPDGRFTFQVSADIADKLSTQLYTFDVVVADINNQEVAAQARALVHKGNFLVGVQPEQFVGRANEENRANVLVVDWAGQPVVDQPVEVVFAEYNRYSVQRKDPDQSYYGPQDSYYWQNIDDEVPLFTTTVTTGPGGEAVAVYTPDHGGIYKIYARATDTGNNTVRASAFTWVSGDEYINWGQQDNDRFELIADKQAYRVGDTAHILVPHPFDGPTLALVTYERGHIYKHFIIDLPNNSAQLEIPITEEMLPNMYISVVVMKGAFPPGPPEGGEDKIPPSGELGGLLPSSSEELPPSVLGWPGLPSFRVGYVNLPIDPDEKQLQIDLTPNKPAGEIYQPREAVSYDISVANAQGEPVQAELSLALVDQAVLSLAPEKPGRILRDFWHSRGLAVETASGLTVAIDRFTQAVIKAKGGGGGCVDCGGFEKGFGETRLNLLDTALWVADFVTDENGRGTVEAELPDNLTTWTLTGIGITGADTLVGENSVDIVSTKPLLVRPVTPRFFVVGDQAQVGVIVQNTTNRPLKIEAKFEAQSLTIGEWRVGQPTDEGPVSSWGSDWSGQGRPTFILEAGQRIKVEYRVTVEKVPAARLTMGAKSVDNTYGDALTIELPVYRESTPETVATAGQLDTDGTRTEGIALPNSFDPTQGDLTIDLDPSLAAGMRDGLTYLEHFPYECTEQTVSRFLPNAVTYRAYRSLEMENPDLAEKLPDLLSIDVQRLYQYHHFDGGWGWWADDESNPYLTAYVLLGLVEAERAGFTVNKRVMEEGAAYLTRNLLAPDEIKRSWQANRQAFILYVLAEAGQGDLGRSVALFEHRRELLDLFGKAYLAMALHLLHDDAPQIDTLLSDIHSAAIVSATGTHWEERNSDRRAMNTDTRTTAVIIAALARIQPEYPGLPNAVRWLMKSRRSGGYWRTTQETAWAIMGLTDYMLATGELTGNYTWRVTLNDGELGTGTVEPANIDETTRLRVEVGELLADTVNRVVIERGGPPPAPERRGEQAEEQEGSGRLYYAAYLTYYKPVEEVTALNRGIEVSREYRLHSSSRGAGREGEAISKAGLGDVIEVRLTIEAPNDLHYVLVEDPLPAGTEAINTSLATTSLVDKQEAESYDDRRFFTHTELRDEKAVLFATYLRRGTYRYTYLIRASLPGRYHVIPPHAEEMYFPEVFGRGDGSVFTVGE